MKNIAIIGAGISGLFLANLLEKDRNYSYKIFEKKNSLDLKDGYGIQLSVNSIKLLNKIGFQNINASDVSFPKKVNFYTAKNLKKISTIDLSRYNNDNNRYTTLKRSKLIEFLLMNIPKEKLVFNSNLLGIKNKDRLLLSFENNVSEKFDYLVAADGIYSKTKKILFENHALPKYFNSIALRGKINNFNDYDISIYLGSNFHFVIYPVNQNNEFNFILVVRKKLPQNKILNEKLLNDSHFINNIINDVTLNSKINLADILKEIKCFPIFVSKKIKLPKSKNIFLIGDAFYSFPPSFAQGASQSIEAASDLINSLKNDSVNYYNKRVIKTKQINFRSSLNHFAFHLSNPINVFFRNIFLKHFSKNKIFLENYLGKIYND